LIFWYILHIPISEHLGRIKKKLCFRTLYFIISILDSGSTLGHLLLLSRGPWTTTRTPRADPKSVGYNNNTRVLWLKLMQFLSFLWFSVLLAIANCTFSGTADEKRDLVAQRIAADELFSRYSPKHAEPWKWVSWLSTRSTRGSPKLWIKSNWVWQINWGLLLKTATFKHSKHEYMDISKNEFVEKSKAIVKIP